MQKCMCCGNENLSDESKFCNICGSFIKLSNKEIQYKRGKFDSKMLLEETLVEGIKVIKEDNLGNPPKFFDIFLYRDLIFHYLIETTNIGHKLNLVSQENFLESLLDVLMDSINFHEKEILNEFLVRINEIYEKNKIKNKFQIKFIFYTNIKLRDSQKEKFQELVDFFNLEIFNFLEYNFQDENRDCNIFQSPFVLLSFTTKGNDYDLMKNDAINTVYSFFGCLTFLANSFRIPIRYHVNEFTLDYNLVDLYISSVIDLDLENSFIDYAFAQRVIDASKKLKKSKFPKFDNNYISYDFYKCLAKSNNKSIIRKIFEYFNSYYFASVETELNMSFIKFWTLSEKIIKDIANDMPEDKLVRYMQKILRFYHYPNYIQKRLPHIKDKRNKFIHESISNFNQNDRNIIKLVADNILWFVMEYDEVVRNMGEYKIILDYFNQDNKRTMDILNFIEENMK